MKLKEVEGWEIWINSDGEFHAQKEGEETISEKTLEAVEREIERLRKASAKRISFLEISTELGIHKPREGEITSVNKKQGTYGDNYEVWISRKNEKGRSERCKLWHFPTEFIKPCEANQKIMGEYIELKKQKEEIENLMNKKQEEFEFYTAKEILENFGFKYVETDEE